MAASYRSSAFSGTSARWAWSAPTNRVTPGSRAPWLRQDDWVTPRLYGQPWFEKPILYYWAAARDSGCTLPAEWAARLPSALAALAAALTIGWLAQKHYDGDAASLSSPVLLAPLLFSTSIAAIGFARAATPDMLFSASITLAMASAATVFQCAGALCGADDKHDEARRARSAASSSVRRFFGTCRAGKGPSGNYSGGRGHWPLGVSDKTLAGAFRAAHPLAIAAFCLVALPWYALCAVRNPDFVHIFIFQHNFERYLTPMFQHRQPFWFFLPITLLAILPWTVLLWPAAQEGCASLAGKVVGTTRPDSFSPAGLCSRFSFSVFRSPNCPVTFCRPSRRWRCSARFRRSAPCERSAFQAVELSSPRGHRRLYGWLIGLCRSRSSIVRFSPWAGRDSAHLFRVRWLAVDWMFV